jgi:hypothetical protein
MSRARRKGHGQPVRSSRVQPTRQQPKPPVRRRPERGWLRRHWRGVGLGGAALVAILLLLPIVRGGNQEPPGAVGGPPIHFVGTPNCPADGAQPYGSTAPSLNAAPAMGRAVDEMPHTHISAPTKVTYNHDPPTSGCHYSLGLGTAPISPGLYRSHVDPEYWVHNLEHGYIVVLYNCPSGCPADITTLTRWFDGHAPDPALTSEKKIIVIPWTTMSSHFAVESWDWFMPLDTADLTKIEAFYQNHVDQSPEGNQAS